MSKQRKDCLTFIQKYSRRRWNTHKTLTLVSFDHSFNCLSVFIHSNQLFQTITQSFHIALSHINARRRINYPQAYSLSAGVIIIRAGGGHPKIFETFSKKSHSTEICRTVPKKSRPISLYIETNYSL